jgi:hypothetical protein
MDRTTKKRIEELERRVRELESRPPVVIVQPPVIVPQPAPQPWWYPHPWYVPPNLPYGYETTCGSDGVFAGQAAASDFTTPATFGLIS